MTYRCSSAIILLIFLFSLVARAESPYLTDEPPVPTDTSSFNRKNKTVSFYYEATGGTQSGYTLNAAYFLRPDLQLMFEYSVFGSKADWFFYKALAKAFGNYTDETIDAGSGLHLKYFMGNSIYMRVGASHRDYHYTRTFNSNSNQSYFDAEVNYLTLGFGNDWQWDNFLLGLEWFKFNVPFGYKLTNERIASGDSLTTEKDFAENGRSLQFGLHVGLSF
ncbi:MAG: hypothetical protein K2P92_02435 [Bdellovibrionaceae bacterium]|nr:hypothetical protein [Pseudobdellovibrionaceae bacterium]